jgi:hypothetical protein
MSRVPEPDPDLEFDRSEDFCLRRFNQGLT